MQEWCKIILIFKANTKLFTLTEKRQTVNDKRGEIMVTWSLLLFAVNASLNPASSNFARDVARTQCCIVCPSLKTVHAHLSKITHQTLL